MIGSLTKISDIQSSELLADNDLDILIEASYDKPSQLKRNQATLGGEIAQSDERAEIPAVLLALDADLIVEGLGGVRTIALNRFFDDVGQTELEETEIIKSIEFDIPETSDRLFYDRLSRTENDISLVNLAFWGRRKDSGFSSTRIAAGAIDETVVRLPEVEAFVEGLTGWDEEAEDRLEEVLQEHVHPPDDFRASADYRRSVLTVFVKRAITGEHDTSAITNGQADV